MTYVKVPLEERKYAVRKPDVPGAVLFHGDWYLPLEVLADDERTMPLTRPDHDAYFHARDKTRKCRCDVCLRPESQIWKDIWRAEARSGENPPHSRSHRRMLEILQDG